ncbi:MAG: Ycf66 family protein [Synechococcus lacustris]|jgi:hypothetical protein
MVNASLNWASIVGIVLAVGGTMLYFLRSFKPALARDYDVFFAAVGLLCGGILFFQGWRLDPILQFGQFLLASTTVFFAYESVRLRSVTTEQARRSSFFDDEEPLPTRPRMGRGEWGGEDRLEDPQPLRRRIRSRVDEYDEAEEPPAERDFYRPRRPERTAIPERAQSRFGDQEEPLEPPTSRTPARPTEPRPDFGARRRERDGRDGRGSRPSAPVPDAARSSRRPVGPGAAGIPPVGPGAAAKPPSPMPQGSPISDADFSPLPPRPRPAQRPSNPDNSSRFDD